MGSDRHQALTPQEYTRIVQEEMVLALGCTEPIAIALCGAKARSLLGDMPERIDVYCSANIIKNTHSVVVPNSGGRRGIPIAAALGIVAGDPALDLQVLTPVKPADIAVADALAKSGKLLVHHAKDIENLYIRCLVSKGEDTAEVTIADHHNQFVKLRKNDHVYLDHRDQGEKKVSDVDQLKQRFRVKDIFEFATTVDFDEIPAIVTVLKAGIESNYAIAKTGLKEDWGQQVGKTLFEESKGRTEEEMIALACAGSDARMDGCSMPVMINSGSGNQGITATVPLIHFAVKEAVEEEALLRSVLLAGLIGLYEKTYIGNLSAYCGAVSAAAATAAGIAYLRGCDYDCVTRAIVNTLAVSSGIICDGAKASCAGKIAVSLRNAQMGVDMATHGRVFQPLQGILGVDIEKTLENVGRLARCGMEGTDEEILAIMLDQS